MGIWSDRVVPRLTDRALAADEIAELRAQACSGMRGRVLEIGFGSGLNVDHYPPVVDAVHAVEPSDLGWRLSAPRRARSRVRIERTGLDGQRLTEADGACDAALSTFTLCTVADPARALREIRRVLRPGGRLHVLEHGLAPDATVARWQRRLEPTQRRVFAGCHLTRDVRALVQQAGYSWESLDSEYLPGPAVMRPWSYGYLGVAVSGGP